VPPDHNNNNNNNKNECHSNIIVDKLQGCSHSKKLRESESESRSSSREGAISVVFVCLSIHLSVRSSHT